MTKNMFREIDNRKNLDRVKLMGNGDVVFTVEMDGQPGEIRISNNGHALRVSVDLNALLVLPEAGNAVRITLADSQMDFRTRPEIYRHLIEE
jgi:hypothetical protein